MSGAPTLDRSAAPKWLRRLGFTAHVAVFAVIVPVTVAGTFPPPVDSSPVNSLLFLVWLSFVGGMAGYGLWKMP